MFEIWRLSNANANFVTSLPITPKGCLSVYWTDLKYLQKKKTSLTIATRGNAAAIEQEMPETDFYAWRVCKVSFRTLRVIKCTVANGTTWRPDRQTTRVEQVARPVTIFRRLVHDLSAKQTNK